MINFTTEVVNWYLANKRELPWRARKLPYNVWLSEVILQQTRVDQGLPYYLKFIETFPTVFDLAAASEEEVLKLWQGLGYYSRARNLHFSAKFIAREMNGVFPKNYEDLKKLKGVGDYTAGAIASICYGEPVAVLDGNVFRVLSRFFGIDVSINTTVGKKIFKEKAEEVLDRMNPGRYNQAVMEFGALHCKPKNPLCATCPLQAGCVAFQQGKIDSLPIKLKKTKVRKRYLNYLVFRSEEGETWIQKRLGKDIWKNLYEFPLVESTKNLTLTNLLKTEALHGLDLPRQKVGLFNTKPIVHQLSHQKLLVKFWMINTAHLPVLTESADKRLQQISWSEVNKYPVPALIHKFLNTFEQNG